MSFHHAATVQQGQGAPHSTSDKLEDQAASAALYVTRDTSSSKASSHPVLDEDGKLSSAGAATSLKYARAQDLPSFPSQGGVSLASAGAAASLADKDKKPFEHWKPGALPAANKAAMQAKDYEMDPLWHPELSKAGSKAALLAQRDTKSPDSIYTPSESENGLSAASQALSNKKSTPAITERNVGASDHRKALMAATGAMAGSRRRAGSAPMKPQTNNNNWALKAATSSHKAQAPTEFTTGDPGFEAARIQNQSKSTVNRQMYGSAPPVAIEVEERNRQAMLRASAVAMAQKMYAIQQTHIDEAKGANSSDSHVGARTARNRALSDSSSNSAAPAAPPKYHNLEEQARKLAQERLAKLHDEHAEYRQYYGASSGPQKSRLAMRGRRRATSLDSDDDSDEEQSRKIKSQMSIFQSKLAEVDSKKRQSDRDALLQAAHKNVTAQMNKMDEKVFADTGKTSPQQRELWERQARERAQRDSDDRMVNVGKVHIGGGKYLDQSEVDAIARARLQPTLDDITAKAEAQRARDEEIRLDQERQKREADNEKLRQAELKQDLKNAQDKEKLASREKKAEEKRVQQEEATAAKEKRQAEAAAEKEKARLEKEEKRKSQGTKPGRFTGILGRGTAGAVGGTAAAGAGAAGAVPDITRPTTSRLYTADSSNKANKDGLYYDDVVAADDHVESHRQTTADTTAESKYSVEVESDEEDKTSPPADVSEIKSEPVATEPVVIPATTTAEERPMSPASPAKGDSKVKSWFMSRFRTQSKAQNDSEEKPELGESTVPTSAIKSSDEEEMPRSDSMRDVAMAGRISSVETDDMYGDEAAETAEPVSPVKEKESADGPGPAVRDRSPSISSLSEEAPSRPTMSTERPASETVESESEQRGRKGFRQRLLSKVKRDKQDKEKEKAGEMETQPAGESTHMETTGEDNDEFEEARDTFEEQKLAPPPKISSAATGGSPRGSRERSKFTEDL